MINVVEVMDSREQRHDIGEIVRKDECSAIQRLNNIQNMIYDLERSVNSARVGMPQAWVDAYDNLYNSLQVCKKVEKDNI